MTEGAPIRVLHVMRPAAGGMKRHLELLCPRLAAHGCTVDVAAPPGFTADLLAPTRIHTVSIEPRLSPVADMRAALRLRAIGAKYDLIHAHGLRAAWIAALAFGADSKPFLFTAHNLASTGAGLRLFGVAARRATAVIAVSNAVAASLTQLRLNRAPVVIPNGIDLTPFDTAPTLEAARDLLVVPQKTMVVAAVGRLSTEKGFAHLIAAAANIPDALFLIAGEGPERPLLEAIIEKLDLASRVRLLGRVADVAGLFAASDIVVVPSLQEGQGISALEAMASRKPVVTSKVGGLVETVVEGETGILVPPGEPSLLAVAIKGLLENPECRDSLGQAGRRRVEQLYSADLMAERTFQLYTRLLR